MRRAVCTLCTSFGSWSLFGLFPFKGSAYGAYGRIRMTMESGLSPTARRHWGASCLRKRQVHTAVHTAFPPCNPSYRPPIGNGRRNRPDDPAPGRDGISTDSTHPPIPVGIVAGHLPQGGPYMPFFGPSGGLSPQEAPGRRASPPSAPIGPSTGYGAPPAPKRGDPLRPLDFLPRLKAGDSYSASLMGHCGSVGSRFTGDRVAAGLGQPPSHIASTGV